MSDRRAWDTEQQQREEEEMNASPKVYSAICAIIEDLSKKGIAKDQRNQQGSGYNFRGIDAVYFALSPLLAKHKLCILPRVVEQSVVERQSRNGGALFYTTVKMEFDFISAEDGSKHTVGPMIGEAMDSGDKSSNKAMSAAFKYAAFEAFCIPVAGDNDADATTHEVAADADDEALEAARNRIEAATSVDDLTKAWRGISKYFKSTPAVLQPLAKLKDARLNDLEPA